MKKNDEGIMYWELDTTKEGHSQAMLELRFILTFEITRTYHLIWR